MSRFVRVLGRRLPARLVVLGLWLGGLTAHAGLWITGYYPGYEQSGGLPAAAIDFSALTHIIHFSAVPNPDGTLNSDVNYVTPENSASLVALAHAAGVKVLISVGGSSTEAAFRSATRAGNLPAFLSAVTNFVASRGYDGVDIDWEPCPSADFPLYTNLLAGLHAALHGLGRPQLLTVAAAAYPPYGDSAGAEYAMFSAIQNQLDQINIMTYDMSGPYDGWVTWFNSPIYDGGYRLPSSGALVPSVDGSVENFISHGVASGKLAIATAFYGYVWAAGAGAPPPGITQPRQSWTVPPTATATRYADIMANYYASNYYSWDSNAQSAYLSIGRPNVTNHAFVSFDDPRTCQAKVSYARNKGLGGIAIWELGQDHTANVPDPLLEAMKQAVAAPGSASRLHGGNDLSLTESAPGTPQIKEDGGMTNQAKAFGQAPPSP